MAKRLGGQSGSIYLAGSTQKLADSYFWQAELQQELLPCSIKGEDFERYAATIGTGRVRVQSFVPLGGQVSPLSSLMNASLVTSAGGGIPIDFTLDIVDTNRIFVGQGYIIRSQLHVQRDGIVTDEIEIQIDGRPTTVN